MTAEFTAADLRLCVCGVYARHEEAHDAFPANLSINISDAPLLFLPGLDQPRKPSTA